MLMSIVEQELNAKASGEVQNEMRDTFSYLMEPKEKLVYFSKYSFFVPVILLHNKRASKWVEPFLIK